MTPQWPSASSREHPLRWVRAQGLVLALCAGLAPMACGDDGDTGSGSETAGESDTSDGACVSTEDCSAGNVCVAYGPAGGACTPQCSATVDECGGEASCAGVGATSINVCQEPQAEPKPEEEPRIPCTSDAECEALESGLICVEFKGESDCTLPCSQESECDVPSVGGITSDFLTCLDDEGDPSRKGCVPDEACFMDPLSCTDLPFP